MREKYSVTNKKLYVICICLIQFIIFSVVTVHASNNSYYIYSHNINLASGNKQVIENDIFVDKPMSLSRFTRHYNSQYADDIGLGRGWTFTHGDYLEILDPKTIHYVRYDSAGELFHRSSKQQGVWVNMKHSRKIIKDQTGGYKLKNKFSDNILFFNKNGRLTSVEHDNYKIEYDYSKYNETKVRDSLGSELILKFHKERLRRVISKSGIIQYKYDENKNLVSVINSDNTSRQYLYEYQNTQYFLTGIIDENANRVLHVTYNDYNSVASCAFADNLDRIEIKYLGGFKRSITDSNGKVCTYKVITEIGKGTEVKVLSGSGCKYW